MSGTRIYCRLQQDFRRRFRCPPSHDLSSWSLLRLILKVSKRISKKQNRKTWRKLLNVSDETLDVSGLKESLDAFIIEFQVREAFLNVFLAYDRLSWRLVSRQVWMYAQYYDGFWCVLLCRRICYSLTPFLRLRRIKHAIRRRKSPEI